ncbi:hypothetical protein SAMN05660860_02300 [Geoalkalibacter ferrihydriticus]|uniref:Uncharacterized protein n=2 Tax=Geoalkalibacter ferrihydriticus TaxID=392333 RepID=A0A0C2HZ58_9BACT|nr:hypothetical protein [Geoalkalibacter ferrihydriticus]KIH78027.1 hypothetical protein GFER_05385 [Geoalkalibacter ferrihydriticus DSM 17813]SDM32499.1 hypothetical protein SAMN05660860_02300 [Geoalkalibacter ferrihydriticus]
MERKGALLATCFCAGLLGGLVYSLTLWAAGFYGFTAAAGVLMTPDFSLPWLYPNLIWGGLWGLVYFPTVASYRHRKHWIRKGLWISLLPALFALLYLYPQVQRQGLLGLELGNFTPLFVLLFHFAWGAATGIFTRMLWGKR